MNKINFSARIYSSENRSSLERHIDWHRPDESSVFAERRSPEVSGKGWVIYKRLAKAG